MRVISRYRDFYDRAGFIDPSIIFVRNQEELPLDIPHPEVHSSASGLNILGFCGRIYPYIHRGIKSHTNKYGRLIPEQNFYFYSFEDYKKSEFWNDETSYRWRSKRLEQDYQNFFSSWKDTDKPFLELDAPYFKMTNFTYHNDKGKALTNPKLVEIQFGKVMNATSVFQALQFYLTNQLVKIKDPDDIDDKYRIAKHGFDTISFRNPYRVSQLAKKKK